MIEPKYQVVYDGVEYNVVNIVGTPYEYTNLVVEAALAGYVTSKVNRHFPQTIGHNMLHCEMLKPVNEVAVSVQETVAEDAPKEPTQAQIKKQEMMEELAAKVDLEEQAGVALAELPPETPKRGRRSTKQ